MLPISLVIPTYQRDDVLVATIKRLLDLSPRPAEILVLDQTQKHQESVETALRDWDLAGDIRLIRLAEPSIPRAMNRGLHEARRDLVLFVDDDVIPEAGLAQSHLDAAKKTGAALIAGRVIQPWHEGKHVSETSMRSAWVSEFIGCNFAVRRDVALTLGGFDEQFVSVAYNFESEFAYRLAQAGHQIFYEPRACVHHLRISNGGTRTFGDHLRSFRPHHAVGAYYYILRTWSGWQSLLRFIGRPLRSVSTRHHLRRPWWIPATLFAEISGMTWAIVLAARGPRYFR